MFQIVKAARQAGARSVQALLALSVFVVLSQVSVTASASGQCQEVCDQYAADLYQVRFSDQEIERLHKKIRDAKDDKEKLKYAKLIEKAHKNKRAAQDRLPKRRAACVKAIRKATPLPKKVQTNTCEECEKAAADYDSTKFGFDFAAAQHKTAKSCTENERLLGGYEGEKREAKKALERASKALETCEKKYCVGKAKD